MNRIFILCLLLFSAIPLKAQDSIISPQDLTTNCYRNGDTIVDLNRLNKGIRSYTTPDASTKILEKNGLVIPEKSSVIIVKDVSRMSNRFSFDIKTFAKDGEWYENEISFLKQNNQLCQLHIQSDKIEMATGWRKDGKIFVVIAVVAILFLIVLGYLFILDRKTISLSRKVDS